MGQASEDPEIYDCIYVSFEVIVQGTSRIALSEPVNGIVGCRTGRHRLLVLSAS